jgi:hypothetical protein
MEISDQLHILADFLPSAETIDFLNPVAGVYELEREKYQP